MHYHFVGICGVSMSGVAKLLVAQGHKVTGSDINNCHIVTLSHCQKDSVVMKQCSNVTVYNGHSETNITKNIDEVIYTVAAADEKSPGFVELKKARELGIKTTPRSRFIGRLMNDKIGISVTGMHGKTTTTTMISLILEAAGYNPTCLVGSEVKEWKSNVRIGGKSHCEALSSSSRNEVSTSGIQNKLDSRFHGNDSGLKFGKLTEYFVTETDESARQMLNFRPKIAVITNLDCEHLDTYTGGMKDVRQAFKKFIKLLPSNGLLVVWQEDKNLMPLTKVAKCKVKRISIKKPWPGINLKIPGRHNLLDATFAARVCHELGVSHEVIKDVLNNFTGASRRFEIKGEKNGILVIDDYGHHPTEIINTIKAAREYMANRISHIAYRILPIAYSISHIAYSSNKNHKRYAISDKQNDKLILVYQPHQYQRTKLLFDDFVKAFDGVDELILTDVYLIAGREKEISENLAKKLAETIKNVRGETSHIKKVHYIESNDNYQKIVEYLKKDTKKGDLVLTMGATDIYKVGEELLK